MSPGIPFGPRRPAEQKNKDFKNVGFWVKENQYDFCCDGLIKMSSREKDLVSQVVCYFCVT
jgi:hypothetical protein